MVVEGGLKFPFLCFFFFFQPRSNLSMVSSWFSRWERSEAVSTAVASCSLIVCPKPGLNKSHLEP